MRPRVYVGNDVVDLEDPRVSGKANDGRFLARVFTEEERAGIAAAADPDLELWCLWAAKETAFKVVSKLLGAPPPFEHAAFRVGWGDAAAPGMADPADSADTSLSTLRAGAVHYRDFEARVRVGSHPGSLHASGFGRLEAYPDTPSYSAAAHLLHEPGAAWDAPLDRLLERFTEREADAIRSHASAAVRVGARSHLADLFGIDESRLEIVSAPGAPGRRPPHVWLDGGPAECADVSLSHSGRWIAWAIWSG